MAKRSKQAVLPGMEQANIPEIERAAEYYVQTRDERMALGKQESLAHDELLELMRQHELPVYEFDGQVVAVNSTTKVSVRKKKAESNGDD